MIKSIQLILIGHLILMHFIEFPNHFAIKDFIVLCTKTEKVFSFAEAS